jgi:hypothetical protein
MKQFKDHVHFTSSLKNQLRCVAEVLFSSTDALAVLQAMILILPLLDVQLVVLY